MLESVVGGAAWEMQSDECRMQNEATAIAADRRLIFILHSAFIVLHSPSCHNTVMDGGVLHKAIDALPVGRWAVGVSGGADSVALLLLLKHRPDLSLHVAHLDHETRAGESTRDAEFVTDLAKKVGLTSTIETRSAIEKSFDQVAKNISDRYRRARFALFRRVVTEQNLQGVVLAHHADDQAETVLMRILRGSAAENLGGMRSMTVVNGLHVARPLLETPPQKLREFLQAIGQRWREDASNQSNDYLRNRVRHWLGCHPATRVDLLRLESASRQLRQWLDQTAPVLNEVFRVEELIDLPRPLAWHSAGRWLIDRGSPPKQVGRQACERLLHMCVDAASPPGQHFPGGLLVRRTKGIVRVQG